MTARDVLVRQLDESDAAAFRAIRLEALQGAPEAFGSSYEAEKDRTIADFGDTLSRNHIAGAWRGGQLVGTAGFYALAGVKQAHRGNIWGVYVCPDQRGAGIARALLDNVLAEARQSVLQVHLSVVAGNAPALALYKRLGFIVYGTEPRSLRIDERFFDEHLMVLRFDH